MRGTRVAAVTALGMATALLLSGCFGPGKDELIAQAQVDFDALVDQAAAVDVAVLHSLEVEVPVSEPCSAESDEVHTVFIAAGTIAIQATRLEERDLLKEFEQLFGDEDRWTEVHTGLSATQRAYTDGDGIAASVKIDDGLLLIAMFSPCRS